MGYEDIKNKGFDNRTTDELLEITKKGGRASGAARRKKADFRNTLNKLLTAEIDSPEWTPLLESLGLESTLESALNMAIIKEGLAGNVKAFEAVAKYAGQSDKTEADDREQRIRTDRAKRARDVEVGDISEDNDNIQSFLNALKMDEEDISKMFSDEVADEIKEESDEV